MEISAEPNLATSEQRAPFTSNFSEREKDMNRRDLLRQTAALSLAVSNPLSGIAVQTFLINLRRRRIH